MATTQAPDRERSNLPAVQQSAPVAPGETASSAIAAREKAAVEAKFLVAINRPRNPDNARARLLARCQSPRFAEVAEYAKPLGGGKKAFGASIRMMEEISRQWGNVDVQSFVIFDDDERRIVRVTATELETNYSSSADVILEKTVERRNPRDGDEVLSRRTNSTGATVYRIRADEDAFLVKQNAAVSKARRECIRAIVPGDLVEEAMEIARDVRRGEVKKDPSAARKRVADSFFSLGVMPAQLSEFLGKPSLEAITEAEIELLRSLYTAMRDEGATWQEIMDERANANGGSGGKTETAAKGTEGLKEALSEKAKAAPAPEKPAKAAAKGAAPAAEATPAAAPKDADVCEECGQKNGKHIASCWYALHEADERR